MYYEGAHSSVRFTELPRVTMKFRVNYGDKGLSRYKYVIKDSKTQSKDILEGWGVQLVCLGIITEVGIITSQDTKQVYI